MPVTKSMRECYEVREDQRYGEWANITLACWENPRHPDYGRTSMYYCGEITIQSSFGTWGNIWTACGVPFKKFLIGVEFDYVFTKFMGAKLHRFDGEASLQEARKWITGGRRDHRLSKQEAREAWDALDDACWMGVHSNHEFGSAMMDVASELGPKHPLHDNFADPCGWPSNTHYDAQALGFWRQLWPLFVETLKAETTQPTVDKI